MMTPNDIDILLHYHCTHAKHPRFYASAVTSALEIMLRGGLLEETNEGDVYTTTDRGKAHVEQLCSLPWPKIGDPPIDKFKQELGDIINKYSKENVSNTPDYIIRDFLCRCLDTFNLSINDREHHFGRRITNKKIRMRQKE